MNSRILFLFMSLLACMPMWASAQARNCSQANLGQGWSYQQFAAQAGAFSVSFDVTPTGEAETLVGLANGKQPVADQFAAVVRFSAAGNIEARNGATFSADKVVSYHANVHYLVRLDVDLTTHSYSAWVRERGARMQRPLVQIGKGLAFSAATAAVAPLDTLGVQVGSATPNFSRGDSAQVCRLTVQAVTPPAPPNADCSLIVPDAPLTAQGLATPYQLVATDPAKGDCHQVNSAQSAFVQAAIFDPATAQISIYSPLVIDKGSTPAAEPVLPTLPRNAIIGIWFGYNGDNLTLSGRSRSALSNGQCVNGVPGSVFGQFAYCNAPAFFDAAYAAIKAGKLKVPTLGMGIDGQDCPTSRSFWVVDQDPSDNVPTEYLAINGKTAQATAANAMRLPGASKFGNPSDERLVSLVLDPVLGCTPFKAANMADPGSMVPALPLNELQASVYQRQPAIVPVQDPMVQVDGVSNLDKLNLYRAGVGQPPARSVDQRSAAAYCRSYRDAAPARFQLDRAYFTAAKSPAPADANSLFTFLARRYVASYQILNCESLLGKPVNVQLTTDGNDVVVDASFTP